MVMRASSENFPLLSVYSIPVLLSAISIIVTGKPNEMHQSCEHCVFQKCAKFGKHRSTPEARPSYSGSYANADSCPLEGHLIDMVSSLLEIMLIFQVKKHVYVQFFKAVPGSQL